MPPQYFNTKRWDTEHSNNLNITPANYIMPQFGCCLIYYEVDLYSSIQHLIAQSDVIGDTKHNVTDMAVILSVLVG